jgi:CheY-like chemotaxis protein
MKKTKTLIVEDEIFVAKDLQMHLEKMGHKVASMVPSGEQAIQETENEVPDLVLMDIVLQEGMDGIETADIIRSRFGIPVIFLTAHEDRTIFERAKKDRTVRICCQAFSGGKLT